MTGVLRFLMLAVLGSLLLSGCAGSGTGPQNLSAEERIRPPLILIGLDGFRPDYLNRGRTPTLSALAAKGALSLSMRPAFPSLTFPNHYTLVTGLPPDRHGVVDNTMRDPAIPGALFRLSDRAVNSDPRWWEGATPIWVTAERAGMRTGTMFWPGSDVPVHGVRPTHWLAFDAKMPAFARVDTLLGWLDLPADRRPGFMTLYFEGVDVAGHRYGPDAPEILDALTELDAAILRLVDGLKARGLYNRVNLVFVADHGMAGVSPDRTIPLDTVLPAGTARYIGLGANAGIEPSPGQDAAVAAALLKPHPHMQCWRKADIPARFSYGTHRRVPPFYCMAETGWLIVPTAKPPEPKPAETKPGETKPAEHKGPLLGQHGFDNRDPTMAALFLAHGPGFRAGKRLGAFDNVDIYPLMTRLLGLKPEPNTGSLTRLSPALTR